MVPKDEIDRVEVLNEKIKNLITAYEALIEEYHSNGFSLKQSIKKTDDLLQ